MTTIEMKPLLDHPDPQVKKLAEHYGELWDAVQSYAYCVETKGPDSDDAFESYEGLKRVIKSQPNNHQTSERLN